MKILAIIGSIFLAVILIVVGVAYGWFNTWLSNKVDYIDQKIDDATNYETIKKVEDSCRAMIASYESDKLTYEMYKDSDNEEKQSWAEQARMRANKTASSYNNYVLENSFVWRGNVPSDILGRLPYLED
jgi:hypothetical protein